MPRAAASPAPATGGTASTTRPRPSPISYGVWPESWRPEQRSIDDIAIVCGAYNLMPRDRSELVAYADAGVEQFVLSLRSYQPDEMADELEHLVRTLM
jgi:hypothetical protein